VACYGENFTYLTNRGMPKVKKIELLSESELK
jgi:hypothetical protein